MLGAQREQDPLYLVEVTGYLFRAHIDQMPAKATGVPLRLLSNHKAGIPARVCAEDLYYFGTSPPRSLPTIWGAYALCIKGLTLSPGQSEG
jgi:hypothetical protein